MSRIRASQNLNGRFRVPQAPCNCTPSAPRKTRTVNPLIYDKVESQRLNLLTDKIQPVNGLLEEWLGSKDASITTIGISIGTQDIFKLALGLGGGIVLGGLMKKALKIK